jgi:hypothetical protein
VSVILRYWRIAVRAISLYGLKVYSSNVADLLCYAYDDNSNTPDDIKKHEETTSNYLNALILFNAAFEQAKEIPTPITMIDDYVFVRAV